MGAIPSKEAKGVITLYIYEDIPVESKFEGDLKGNDMALAIRGLIRGYRKWKQELSKTPVKLGGE